MPCSQPSCATTKPRRSSVFGSAASRACACATIWACSRDGVSSAPRSAPPSLAPGQRPRAQQRQRRIGGTEPTWRVQSRPQSKAEVTFIERRVELDAGAIEQRAQPWAAALLQDPEPVPDQIRFSSTIGTRSQTVLRATRSSRPRGSGSARPPSPASAARTCAAPRTNRTRPPPSTAP